MRTFLRVSGLAPDYSAEWNAMMAFLSCSSLIQLCNRQPSRVDFVKLSVRIHAIESV